MPLAHCTFSFGWLTLLMWSCNAIHQSMILIEENSQDSASKWQAKVFALSLSLGKLTITIGYRRGMGTSADKSRLH